MLRNDFIFRDKLILHTFLLHLAINVFRARWLWRWCLLSWILLAFKDCIFLKLHSRLSQKAILAKTSW